MHQHSQVAIASPDLPMVPGLILRGFQGEGDYPHILAIIEGSKEDDDIERSDTLEEIANNYTHLVNCDPYQDMIFAEVHGEVVAYNRVFWELLDEGSYVYTLFGFMLPAWRRKGIGTAMLLRAEKRLRQIAASHPQDSPRFFQSWAFDTEKGTKALLESQGYQPVRYGFELLRDLSDPIPEAPMPVGLEVRPVAEEHYWLIFDAVDEAFRDHWGHRPSTKEEYESWMKDPLFRPEYWKVAWDGDQVAGTVLNFFNERENEEYGRKRGYTEVISVRRPWRRRGLARSLLVQSMQMFKEMGMTETSHGVDTQNLTGALSLYESVGYRPIKQSITYRKPF
jgi:GNAT superfamily N-acetyltransferase